MNEQQLRQRLRDAGEAYDVPPFPTQVGPRRSVRRWAVPLVGAAAVVAALVVAPQLVGPGAEAPRQTAPAPSPSPSPSSSPSPTVSDPPQPPPRTPRDCPVRAPRELPSGAASGPVRTQSGSPTWGTGLDEVTLLVGDEALEVLGPDAFAAIARWPADQSVVVDGATRVVLPIGDFGVGQVAVLFVVDGCEYALYLRGGTTEQQAMDYAARF